VRASVRFVRSPRSGPIVDIVADLLGDDVLAANLTALGAVWIEGSRATATSIAVQDAVLRLHTDPRRYSPPTDWRSRIVDESEEYVVIDKPAGLPVHPTLDNAIENALASASLALGERLLLTHRLDVGTDGLLVLARTPAAQRRINAHFAAGRVHKTYAARTESPVELGLHRAFMAPGSRAPRRVAAVARPDDQLCELRVVTRHDLPDGFELVVEPITGRTHQIRAQLSALGAPIVGDRLYGGRHDGDGEVFDLTCTNLRAGGHAWQLPRPPRWRAFSEVAR
jgi:23S rRNA pseudouridine1911/1915/1917 synthase